MRTHSVRRTVLATAAATALLAATAATALAGPPAHGESQFGKGVQAHCGAPFGQLVKASKGAEGHRPVTGGSKAFIRRSDLSRDRAEQRPERYSVGDKVDAKVTNIDRGSRRITLSIKAREIDEEKAAVEQYGSSDSGASLGDILGAALKERQGE